jgi:MEMO1 family protein
MKIQGPAVAGHFYPADPDVLRRDVRQFVSAADPDLTRQPKALIAPHAGYVYSGPTAGVAYAQLAQVADQISRVVLLAPSHRVGFQGIAYSSADIFRTPLGDVEVDQNALAQIEDMAETHLLDRAFPNEHSLEVHLPFLQEMLGDFRIIPLLVGDVDPAAVADILERLWGGPETLIVVSSDLSHYLDYETARRLDAETSNAIENLKPENLSHNHACGRTPVSGLLLAAQRRHLRATTLDLRNSGDTAGPRDQVVGYGAYAFS